MARKALCIVLLSIFMVSFSPLPGNPPKPKDPPGDPYVLAKMAEVNEQLAERGLGIAVEEIEFYTIGQSRPSNRIHAVESRWVADDSRREAQGDDLTYLVDQSEGATASGLAATQTESAIDAALQTWNSQRCLTAVDLVKRPDGGDDPDIYDYFFGFGGFGNPFVADIVEAGWMPGAFFDAVGGPGSRRGTLAFTATFIFLDPDGNPSDINGDQRQDTAFTETYFNDDFGDPGGDLKDNPWAIDAPLPSVDVQTVATHENGHALGLGHFGPPPVAVMNPVYAGIRLDPLATDAAGMCSVWASWPR
jgi:hypothetical protein